MPPDGRVAATAPAPTPSRRDAAPPAVSPGPPADLLHLVLVSSRAAARPRPGDGALGLDGQVATRSRQRLSVFTGQAVWVALGRAGVLARRCGCSPRVFRRLAYPALLVGLVLLAAVLVPGVGLQRQRRPALVRPRADPDCSRPSSPSWSSRCGAPTCWCASSGCSPGQAPAVPVLPVAVLMAALIVLRAGLRHVVCFALVLFGLLWAVGAPVRIFGALLGAGRGRGGRAGRRRALPDGPGHLVPRPVRRPDRRPVPGRAGLYALATGGLWGVGLGQRRRSGNLPDAQSDYIFAIIGEELGPPRLPGRAAPVRGARLRRLPHRPPLGRPVRPAGRGGRHGLAGRPGGHEHGLRRRPAAGHRRPAAADLRRRHVAGADPVHVGMLARSPGPSRPRRRSWRRGAAWPAAADAGCRGCRGERPSPAGRPIGRPRPRRRASARRRGRQDRARPSRRTGPARGRPAAMTRHGPARRPRRRRHRRAHRADARPRRRAAPAGAGHAADHLPGHRPRHGDAARAGPRLRPAADPAGAAAAQAHPRPARACPAGVRRAVADGRRACCDRAAAPTSSSASAATSRCRPTSPPGGAGCRSSCTSRTPLPGPGQPARRPASRPGRGHRAGHRRCATASTSACRCGRRSATLDRPPAGPRRRPRSGWRADRPTLLVFGGSQGARDAQPGGGRRRRRADRGRRPGAARARAARTPTCRSPTAPAGDAALRGRDYLERMDLAYAAADLALCRSGAVTVRRAVRRRPARRRSCRCRIGNGEQRRNAAAGRRRRRRAAGRRRRAARRSGWPRTLPPMLADPARLDGDGQGGERRCGHRDADEALAAARARAAPARRRRAGPGAGTGSAAMTGTAGAELGAVHFVGIGGAGMSGIARILLARGVPVSGSDAPRHGHLGRAARARRPRRGRARRGAPRRRRHRGRLDRDPGRQPRAGRGAPARAAGAAPGRGAGRGDGRPAQHRGRRHARQDLDHLDAD